MGVISRLLQGLAAKISQLSDFYEFLYATILTLISLTLWFTYSKWSKAKKNSAINKKKSNPIQDSNAKSNPVQDSNPVRDSNSDSDPVEDSDAEDEEEIDPKRKIYGKSVESEPPHIPFIHRPQLDPKDQIVRSRNFFELMNWRRSIRKFSDRPVPIEVVENIIRTAGTAPSGAHTEPWTYVVIKNAEIKEKLREIVEAEERKNYEKRMGDEWVKDLRPIGTTWKKPYLTVVPFVVVLFKQVFGFDSENNRKTHYSKISII